MSKIKRVQEVCDRLWAETEQITDPQDPVRLAYRHVIAQIREAMDGGGVRLRVSSAEANFPRKIASHRKPRPESDFEIVGSPLVVWRSIDPESACAVAEARGRAVDATSFWRAP